MTSLEFLPNSPTLMNAGRELRPALRLLRAAGGRLHGVHLRGHQAHRPHPQVRRRHRLLLLPPAARRTTSCSVHQGRGQRPGLLHERLRRRHRDHQAGRHAARRQHGHPARRPPGHPRVHHAPSRTTTASTTSTSRWPSPTPSWRPSRPTRSTPWSTRATGEAVGKLNAREVFDLIVDAAPGRTASPASSSSTASTADNPTPQLGEIESTNPCGEQPLLPYESCNLGSINLAQVVPRTAHVDYGAPGPQSSRTAVHFLDNVIDVNRYPLPEIERDDQGQPQDRPGGHGLRRHAGAAGHPLRLRRGAAARRRGHGLHPRRGPRRPREDLADERGVFPNFEGSIFDGPAARRVRNATITTIAPTGTISIIAGCSSGIEPLFAAQLRARTSWTTTEHGRGPPLLRAGGPGARLLQRRAHEEDRRRRAPCATSTDVPDGRAAASSSPPTTSRPSGTSACRPPSRSTPTTPSPRRQLPQRGHRRRRREGLPAGLRAGLQGRHHLPRRQPRGAGAQRRPDQEEARAASPAVGGIATTRPSRPAAAHAARRSAWTPAAASCTSS